MAKKEEDPFRLTKEQITNASEKLKDYIAENFDTEIGNLQASFLVEFISKNIGVYYYNKAIADAQSFMTEKTEDLYLLMKDEA